MLTAVNRQWLGIMTVEHQTVQVLLGMLAFKLAAIPISILTLFLIYWLLPNRKISPRRVLPVAIYVGLMLEAIKYINLAVWPLLLNKVDREYGPFKNSVTILLWSFLAALIVLAGAEWAARQEVPPRCILNPMKNWKQIASAQNLQIPDEAFERIAPALDNLEAVFLPLLPELSWGVDPAVTFRPDEDRPAGEAA